MTTETKQRALPEAEEKAAEVHREINGFAAKLHDKIDGYMEHWNAVREVMGETPEFPDGMSAYRTPVSIGYKPGQTNGILISWHECDDLRKVKPILRRFARRGYRVKKQTDYEEIGRRSWILAHDDAPGAEVIRVHAFVSLNGEGASCRVVETGEMKPVMKIVCPEDEETGR